MNALARSWSAPRWFPSVLLVGAELALVAALVFGGRLNLARSAAPPTFVGVELSAGSHPSTLEGVVPLASRLAETWRPDARPALLGLQVDWPPSPVAGTQSSVVPTNGWIILVYVSAEAGEVRSLGIERRSGVVAQDRTITAETDWTVVPPEIGSLSVTSSDAIAAAERAAGATFRAECSRARHTARASLRDGAAGTPIWFVTYGDDRAPAGIGLSLTVDAQSGAVTTLPILPAAAERMTATSCPS